MLGLLITGGLSIAQNQKIVIDAPSSALPIPAAKASQTAVKGGGDVFWQTTFNWANPASERGWDLPAGWEIKDNTDNGNVWMWRNDTLKGRNTTQAAPDFFVSGKDGFIAVPMDEYNFRDGVSTSVTSDTYIQTEGINCTGKASVVVKFSQYFRLCCSNYFLDMLVTNDDGVHWASYDIRYGVTGNNFTTERFRNVEINISDVAAGLPNVKIRFYMHGMANYFWMIDDLSLSEAYDNDVKIEDYWMDFDNGEGSTIGQINYWPLSQMGMAGSSTGTVGSYFLKAAFLNNGTADAENNKLNIKVLKNGTEILNEFSAGTTIWPLERDTENLANPFLANDYGDYRFDFTAVMDNADENPSNNTASMRFTVNDTLAHRADFTAENFKSTANWSGGGNGGDMVCVDYQLFADAEINSMTAFIGNFTPAQTPQFQFVLMKDIDGNWEELITTDVVNMDSSYRQSWVTLPVSKDGETEFLKVGNYKACVRMWGVVEGDANGTQGMNVGLDLTTKYSGCTQYYTGDGAWHSLAGAPLFMIGMNLNTPGGPTQAPVTFNVSLARHIANGEFHPGTDQVDVKGFGSAWNASAAMTDPDGDGIYSVTVNNLPINKKLEFKYRVNGVEENYPAPGTNRTYVVRYWNEINSLYNNGITTGIPVSVLSKNISLYPNPTQGSFSVAISLAAPAEASLQVLDMTGQVIWTKKLGRLSEHTERLALDLNPGIYFVRIFTGTQVDTEKLVVH
jgi:hypothetical protein